jgi:hypothetical protein
MLRNTALALVIVAAACGSSRVVRRTQYGGIIALEGNRNKALESAHREMAAHCRGRDNYRVILEGEEPIGTITEYGERTDVDPYGESKGGVTETTTKTEYRIHYECGVGPSEPPGGGGGGAY